MYVRVWYEDGSVSDRPTTTVLDGHPAAEWPPENRTRVAVASQAFTDAGCPVVAREERRLMIPAGCGQLVLVLADDMIVETLGA